MFFFFKQKTAYEMRISDWSSDVCSSDLSLRFERIATHGREHVGGLFTAHHRDLRVRPGPKEARRICTTAHAVVAGAVRAADQHREFRPLRGRHRSEEHTSELQSLMRISYAVFCLKNNKSYTHK